MRSVRVMTWMAAILASACSGAPKAKVGSGTATPATVPVAVPASQVAIDLPALAAGAGGACGGFEKSPRAALDVLEGRLNVGAPQGAADIPKAYDIMGAPSPTTEESRVIVESPTGGKLVVFAQELWQTGASELGTRAPAYFGHTQGMPETNLEVGTVAADPSLVVIGARPKTADTSNEAVLVLATIVRTPDGSLVAVDYYVNPDAYGPGCSDLAVSFAQTIKPGKRALDVAGGVKTVTGLGVSVQVTVPPGYVLTSQQGEDFDVHHLRKLVPLSEFPGYLLIYVGEYPDRSVPEGDEGSTPVARKGTLGGKPVTWNGFTATAGGGTVVANLEVGKHGVVVQVMQYATRDTAFLNELDAIASTIQVK